MKKWHIEITATVRRVYEVDAGSKTEALAIFRESAEPALISDEEIDSVITDVNQAE